ncbi:MAG: arsenic resistance N-acetyltransferase ArsN2 [Candidatus Thiodiazotropha sp.]|nr:GNAT family N-acetyltransferase [Candidatus Thiodiazotropha taylori]MBT3059257.1 GNAT family N-acetyltransferase [Candidatus Thiodiazotropha sp. (ex Lucina pensylvanica)]MBT3063278.1 GNAT family N-acetyltransferase [Candidatus Thiodiazotropha sp. (ex Lucina pensylvanica)]MBV2096296.1 GNAT family N-acetyltransferase [Candidatus Thiodiazotropha sp. (ex Codakia orbicularis)]PUB75879.1 MAG: GNAT family N-acetyltransferase [gamma proteobacterium symbiont of Ctena orbiculata]
MSIEFNPISELSEIKALLEGCGLPTEDMDLKKSLYFYGKKIDSMIVAVVGLEILGRNALIRSVAVSAGYRGKGIGKRLVSFAESTAASKGVEKLYLLTTDAHDYFCALGYRSVSRAVVPEAIENTQQFSTICPSNALLMSKELPC